MTWRAEISCPRRVEVLFAIWRPRHPLITELPTIHSGKDGGGMSVGKARATGARWPQEVGGVMGAAVLDSHDEAWSLLSITSVAPLTFRLITLYARNPSGAILRRSSSLCRCRCQV